MWLIAVKTLLADRGKLIAALVGVVFAVVLVNIQGGLFIGLITKASLLVDQSRADIWVGHKKMSNVDFPREIPRRWVNRIRSIPGVVRAEPYVVGHSVMTLPDGGFEPVLLVGCDPNSLLGNAESIAAGDPAQIRRPEGIIIDVYDRDKLANATIGDIREIGGHRAQVVAQSRGILGFLVTPYVFTTVDRAIGYLNRRPDECSYFLVQISDNADASALCRSIKAKIPEVEAYTRAEYSQISIDYWLKRTGLGISFGASTLLGLLVGLVIVGQTLYASVLDRIHEFSTLKAVGASERQICTVVLLQATLLALGGALIGILLVRIIVHTMSTPRAPIVIPAILSLGSSVVVLAMCWASSILPYWRIRSIDPALVLRG